jgi:hypothetical protein
VVPDPNRAGQYITDNYYVGDATVAYSGIRAPRRSNLDLSLTRSFRIRESKSLEFSAHATNALNHAEFGGSIASSGAYNSNLGGINVTPTGPGNPSNTQPGQPTGSSTYGTYGLGTFDPRQLELGLKFRF